MKMLVLTFRDSLEDQISQLLNNLGIRAFTYIPTAYGTGESGAAFGAFSSHGTNAVAFFVVSDTDAVTAVGAFKEFRAQLSAQQHGAVIPMKLFVMPCEEMV